MNKVINFGDYVSALCGNLPELYGQENVKLVCTVESVRVDLDEATALGIIVTELVNNAYLHAFPGGNGVISVALKVVSGQPILSITDNGIGFVEIETKRRGMGLVRRLVQQVGGRLTLKSSHGSTWTIALAADEVPPRIAA